MERPPKKAEWILKHTLSKIEQDIVLGDFEEFYKEMLCEKGRINAIVWFWKQALKSVPLFILNYIYWSIAMFKNYLKLAYRNAKRNKGYTFINIAGLAIGLACCITLLIYVHFELSFDRFHEKARRIYRIELEAFFGGRNVNWTSSNALIGETLVKEYPEVRNFVRFTSNMRFPVKYEDKKFYENRICMADPSVFDVFSFSLIKGDPEKVLSNPNNMVITEKIAQKYFGTADPLGKSMKLSSPFGEGDVIVTGVMKNIPSNSVFNFDILISFQILYYFLPNDSPLLTHWNSYNFLTYLLLERGCDYKSFEKKLPEFINKHHGTEEGKNISYYLNPLTDLHLYSPRNSAAILYVYVFSTIAVFILIIACINFMNLSTARSERRSKEVGLRKVFGSSKGRLIRQFMSEAFIYTFIALIIAFILAKLMLPVVNSLVERELDMTFSDLPWLIPGFILLAVIVGFLSGSYPAFMISRFKPVQSLRESQGTGKSKSFFRNTLVTAQFVISITLLIGTAVVFNQLSFMRNKNPGFNKEHIITIPLSDNIIRESIPSVREELIKNPGIISIGFASSIPGLGLPNNGKWPEGNEAGNELLMHEINVDFDFIKTLGMEIVKGRDFSREYATDGRQALIINETAIKKLGWENPIGKVIRTPVQVNPIVWEDRRIIGVVKDFHSESMREEIRPLFMTCDDKPVFYFYEYMAVRISPDNISGTVNFIRNKWSEFNPNIPFEYSFLDETFDRLFRDTERLREIFSYFTLIAIFIACLGLFGLASYMAQQRTKEIGIRKVLGASVSGIIMLLGKDVFRLLIIANVIAWPLSYFLMKDWVRDFVYRTGINPVTFILSSALVIVIALVTISYQSVKAALANPIDSIKYE